jgi:sugar (pentulose or hexulose) kinase
MKETIAIFDIGKTNKKVLLFDKDLNMVYQKEQKFPEIKDEDNFPCDDIHLIEQWIKNTLAELSANPDYTIKAVNFSTYGATLMYIDENGTPLTPLYNYLKPLPERSQTISTRNTAVWRSSPGKQPLPPWDS